MAKWLPIIGGVRGLIAAVVSALLAGGLVGPEWKPIFDAVLGP
jgi:hypothetical protein